MDMAVLHIPHMHNFTSVVDIQLSYLDVVYCLASVKAHVARWKILIIITD